MSKGILSLLEEIIWYEPKDKLKIRWVVWRREIDYKGIDLFDLQRWKDMIWSDIRCLHMYNTALYVFNMVINRVLPYI